MLEYRNISPPIKPPRYLLINYHFEQNQQSTNFWGLIRNESVISHNKNVNLNENGNKIYQAI